MTTARSRPRVVCSHLAYAVLGGLALLGLAPVWSWRALRDARERDWLGQRLGRIRGHVVEDRPVWVHAVSVGEVKAVRPLVAALRARRPDVSIVLTTATLTGRETATSLYPDIPVFAAPLDLGLVVRRVLRRLRPRCLLLVELEAWPAMLRAADESGVPIAVVNGRMTERSFRRYRAWCWWLPEFERLSLVVAQEPRYAARFAELGVAAGRVHVAGSLKHDLLSCAPRERVELLARQLRLDGSLPVFVAGSTHAGEEQAVLDAWRAAGGGAACQLVLAPRHPDRTREVARLLERLGVPYELRAGASGKRMSDTVLLVDRVGELETLFGVASVVFLGGSLVPVGGHNVLEPALAGCPVLVGPHLENCRADAELLVAAGGARIVADAADLGSALRELLEHPQGRRAMGDRARHAAAGLKGAALAQLDLLVAAGLLDLPATSAQVGRPSGFG